MRPQAFVLLLVGTYPLPALAQAPTSADTAEAVGRAAAPGTADAQPTVMPTSIAPRPRSPLDRGAARRLDPACQEGGLRACLELGRTLLSADEPVRDVERGRELVMRACHGGFAEACTLAARASATGWVFTTTEAVERQVENRAAEQPARDLSDDELRARRDEVSQAIREERQRQQHTVPLEFTADELRARRDEVIQVVRGLAVLTGAGAIGVIAGIVVMLASVDCAGSVLSCHTDGGVLVAGGTTGAVGLLSVIVGAVGLGVVEPERRRLDAARELRRSGAPRVELSFDVAGHPEGGTLTLRGRF